MESGARCFLSRQVSLNFMVKSDTAQFGLPALPQFGLRISLSLGSGIAQFGVRHCSVWGPISPSLGSGFFAGIPSNALVLHVLLKCPSPLDY